MTIRGQYTHRHVDKHIHTQPSLPHSEEHDNSALQREDTWKDVDERLQTGAYVHCTVSVTINRSR